MVIQYEKTKNSFYKERKPMIKKQYRKGTKILFV